LEGDDDLPAPIEFGAMFSGDVSSRVTACRSTITGNRASSLEALNRRGPVREPGFPSDDDAIIAWFAGVRMKKTATNFCSLAFQGLTKNMRSVSSSRLKTAVSSLPPDRRDPAGFGALRQNHRHLAGYRDEISPCT
jgi:hypothetical protein